LAWNIEIFTTTEELPFAGHPTIGAAVYAMTTVQKEENSEIRKAILRTKAGEIPISAIKNSDTDKKESLLVQANVSHKVRIHRNTFANLKREPQWPAVAQKIREAEYLAPFVSIVKGMTFMLVRLESLVDLAKVSVRHEDLGLETMLDFEDGWSQSFVARYYYVIENSSNKDQSKKFIRTRMLEKGMEDPATGSAASALASYLALKEGGRYFEIVQGVEMGRKSVIGVEVELHEDRKSCKAVKLSGTAVQIMEGTISI